MSFSDLLAMGDVPVREILGGTVTYTPMVGSPVDVSAIFTAPHVQVDVGQAGVSSVGPTVFLKLADLPSDPETDTGATITAGAVSYTIHEVQPDGLGGLFLLLHRV
jgi:hypothetical protein